MQAVGFVTVLALVQVMAFQWRVGMARNEFQIPGPATSGHPTWERYNRVHLNTIENLVVFLPLLWLCGHLLSPWVATPLGVLFVVARGIYSRAYVADPETRGKGAWLTSIVLMLLVAGSVAGLVLALARSGAAA